MANVVCEILVTKAPLEAPPKNHDSDAGARVDFWGAVRRLEDGREIEGWRLAQVRDEITNPESWLLMAEDDGVPVGMASAMPSREDHGKGDLVPGRCHLGFVFVVPVGSLIAFFVLAAIAGVLAAIPPARRAAKVVVLRAVTTE